jgi:hypothetical protein
MLGFSFMVIPLNAAAAADRVQRQRTGCTLHHAALLTNPMQDGVTLPLCANGSQQTATHPEHHSRTPRAQPVDRARARAETPPHARHHALTYPL